MRFRIKETKHIRNASIDIDINRPDEEFVGLIDAQNSPTKLKPLVEVASKGLKNGNAPLLCEEGVGGTYFMHDHQRRKVGVFKPQDEEPYNINNPKGFRPRLGSDAGYKEGILVGEASIRECIAYVLDHQNFASVPVTDLVLCQHPAFHYSRNKPSASSGLSTGADMVDSAEDMVNAPANCTTNSPAVASKSGIRAKIGSFQEFVDHDGDCEDISRSLLLRFPVDEVHKIAQLDIRIMNSDRHGGNILYREVINDFGEESYVLIPIDHGYALPSSLSEASFDWLNWPQAKEPMSPTTLHYIEALNVEEEIEMLKAKFGNSLREEHFRVFRLSTMLLKKGAIAGLTFHEIGAMLCRVVFEEPSILENIVSSVLEQDIQVTDPTFYTYHQNNCTKAYVNKICRASNG